MAELKFPKFDSQQIHPTILLIKGKHTRAKVAFCFWEVIFWLKNAFIYLNSYKKYKKEMREERFIKKLANDPLERVLVYEHLMWYLEEVVIRLSGIRDKIAQMALVYYYHPNHLGERKFDVRGCPKCGNSNFSQVLNEKTCNLFLLLNFLKQEGANDDLFKILSKIEKDKDIAWIISQRNILLHRISEYYFQMLGIYPEDLNIKYEDKKETTTFKFGNLPKSLIREEEKIERAYNKTVEYIEAMEPILFPKK